jgi:hypothetical protein
VIEARPEVELQKYSRELGSYHEKKARDGHQMRHHQIQRWRAHRMLQKGEYMTGWQLDLNIRSFVGYTVVMPRISMRGS